VLCKTVRFSDSFTANRPDPVSSNDYAPRFLVWFSRLATQKKILVGTEANQMPKYQLSWWLVLKKPSQNVPFSLSIVEFALTRTALLGADLATEVKVRRQRKGAMRKTPRLHITTGKALCTDTHQDFTTQNTHQTCGTTMKSDNCLKMHIFFIKISIMFYPNSCILYLIGEYCLIIQFELKLI
jgi:hypothetical protein